MRRRIHWATRRLRTRSWQSGLPASRSWEQRGVALVARTTRQYHSNNLSVTEKPSPPGYWTTKTTAKNCTAWFGTTCANSTGTRTTVRLNSVLERCSKTSMTSSIRNASHSKFVATRGATGMIAGLNYPTMWLRTWFVSSIQSAFSQTTCKNSD